MQALSSVRGPEVNPATANATVQLPRSEPSIRDSMESLAPSAEQSDPTRHKELFFNCLKGCLAIPLFIIMLPVLFVMIIGVAVWSLVKTICCCQPLTPPVKENSIAYFKKLTEHHMNHLQGDARANFRQLLQTDNVSSLPVLPIYCRLIVSNLLATDAIGNRITGEHFILNPMMPLFLKDLTSDKKNQLIVLRNYYYSYGNPRTRAAFIDNIINNTPPSGENARELYEMARVAMNNIVSVLNLDHLTEAVQIYLREHPAS